MSDPIELVAKHVHDIRWAERGRAVGPKVTDEDREIARDILADLRTADWYLVRPDRRSRVAQQFLPIAGEWKPTADTQPEGER